MIYLRSALFNLTFYAVTVVIVIAALPLLFLPRAWTVWTMRAWSHLTMWLLKAIAGTTYELRGLKHLPDGPVLIASKHLSMWDTIIYTAILNDPAIVLKRELLHIPFYGWYSRKTGMIAVDRGAGAKAMRGLIAQGRRVLGDRRPIVIFPEGTRAAPGSHNPYKPGVAALYAHVTAKAGLPCVPVAVNSGLYWPRRKFLRKPGTILLEFLEPIAPDLERQDFMAVLQHRIETATDSLLAEGGFTPATTGALPVENSAPSPGESRG